MTHAEAGKLGAIAGKNIHNWLRKQERIVAYYKNPLRCKYCNSVLPYERATKSYHKFCNSSCACKYNNALRASKRKLVCYTVGNLPKDYNKKEIKPISKCLFCESELRHGKKYCSIQCEGHYRKQNTDQKIESGEVVYHRHLRRYLLEKHKICMNPSCCWDWSKNCNVPLELHHLDGNSNNNNVLSNVILLCPNCHALTDTYKAKNAGKGRAWRRKRYHDGKSY